MMIMACNFRLVLLLSANVLLLCVFSLLNATAAAQDFFTLSSDFGKPSFTIPSDSRWKGIFKSRPITNSGATSSNEEYAETSQQQQISLLPGMLSPMEMMGAQMMMKMMSTNQVAPTGLIPFANVKLMRLYPHGDLVVRMEKMDGIDYGQQRQQQQQEVMMQTKENVPETSVAVGGSSDKTSVNDRTIEKTVEQTKEKTVEKTIEKTTKQKVEQAIEPKIEQTKEPEIAQTESNSTETSSTPMEMVSQDLSALTDFVSTVKHNFPDMDIEFLTDTETETEVKVPKTEVATKSQVAAKSIVEIVANTATQVATKPALEAATKYASEVAAKSPAKVATNSVTEIASKSVAENATKSVAKVSSKSVAEIATKSVAEVATKLETEVATKSVTEIVTKTENPTTTTKPITNEPENPTTQSEPNKTIDSTTKPTTPTTQPPSPYPPVYQPYPFYPPFPNPHHLPYPFVLYPPPFFPQPQVYPSQQPMPSPQLSQPMPSPQLAQPMPSAQPSPPMFYNYGQSAPISEPPPQPANYFYANSHITQTDSDSDSGETTEPTPTKKVTQPKPKPSPAPQKSNYINVYKPTKQNLEILFPNNKNVQPLEYVSGYTQSQTPKTYTKKSNPPASKPVNFIMPTHGSIYPLAENPSKPNPGKPTSGTPIKTTKIVETVHLPPKTYVREVKIIKNDQIPVKQNSRYPINLNPEMMHSASSTMHQNHYGSSPNWGYWGPAHTHADHHRPNGYASKPKEWAAFSQRFNPHYQGNPWIQRSSESKASDFGVNPEVGQPTNVQNHQQNSPESEFESFWTNPQYPMPPTR